MLYSTSGLVVNTCLTSAGSAIRTESLNTGTRMVTARPQVRVSHSTVRRRVATNANATRARGMRGDGGSLGTPVTDRSTVVASLMGSSE